MSETTPPNPPEPPESAEESGSSASEPEAPPSEPAPPAPPPPPPGGGSAGVPPSSGSSSGSSGNDTLMLVLCYLGPFALIPFLVEKDNPEVQWHAKNGLVLLGAELVFGVLVAMANWIVPCLPCLLAMVVGLGALVLHVVCIVKALNGERFEIPGLSPLIEKF